MSGIYIHIPFCKQKCTYCDFYTRVAPKMISPLVGSLCKELQLRKDFLGNSEVNTIYFGGGTPSILSVDQFQSIFKAITSNYLISNNAEITFEANPDDLNSQFFESISKLPFNRISIGIQSFDDSYLKLINRRHSGIQAINAVKEAQKHGFKNISIDLIYGLPGQNMQNWIEQLKKAFELNVQHISIYGLTYEQGTPLWKQREKGRVEVVSDEIMVRMYEKTLGLIEKNGFESYEISNFSKPGFRSQHNSAYWKMKPYLGIGPSAHSFNKISRQWNISSIQKYIEEVNSEGIYNEIEELSLNDKYNDYIMVSLRTREGIDLNYVQSEFGQFYSEMLLKNAMKYIELSKLEHTRERLKLTIKGIHLSDMIISELMNV